MESYLRNGRHNYTEKDRTWMPQFGPPGESAIMALRFITCMRNTDRRPPSFDNADKLQSPWEKPLLFSAAARAIVSLILQEKVDIFDHDFRLETAGGQGGAILISERLSSNAEFRKIWATTPCQSILKQLAQIILHS